MTENCELLKVQVNGPLPKRGGGGQTGVPGEKPQDNQPENRYHIIIRGKNAPPQTGIEPAPSDIDDQLASSEHAGSNPLNYSLADAI